MDEQNRKNPPLNQEAVIRELLVALEKRDKDFSGLKKQLKEPVAIVGMACRFPGDVSTPEQFWDLLKEGRQGIIDIPSSRWNLEAFYDPDKDAPGKMYTRKGGFLTQPIDQFDSELFKISSRELEDMDPQQRMLLEVCYEALENSGIAPDSIKNTDTAIFMGMMYNDYLRLLDQKEHQDDITAYYASGNLFSAVIGRLSYYFGTHGPCVPIDTACSSSLVAVDLACQALHLNKSKIALAGGINLTLKPETMVMESKASMLSPDGQCKTFDESADGFSHSEGCGVVVLKKLSDAQKDNDPIYAVIRGSATNHGGASSGLTVPSQKAEESLIRIALKEAELKPNEVNYVEAHGTGTSLGDPIEVSAIKTVYGINRDSENKLMIGSVKTNIGHTESAAGIAGLIKVVLSLQNNAIPPHLNLKKLNPLIDLDSIPAVVPTELVPWEKGDTIRRAGVSSFGFSGINSHVIVEEAPSKNQKENEEDRPLHILTLSAISEEALKELVERYQVYLIETDEKLADICYTANVGRSHYQHRLAVTGKEIDEILKKLNEKDFLKGETHEEFDYEIELNGDWENKISELAANYIKGAVIDWKKLDSGFIRRKVRLPTYPFQRKRYWSESALPSAGRMLASVHPLLGERNRTPNDEILYTGELNLSSLPYLNDHKVYDYTVYPGAGYLEMMVAATRNSLGDGVIHAENISFESALSFTGEKPIETQVYMTPDNAEYQIGVYSLAASNKWNVHAKGSVRLENLELKRTKTNLEDLRKNCTKTITKEEFYQGTKTYGIFYGENFQVLDKIHVGNKEVLGELKLPTPEKGYLAHPALLDGCLQLLLASIMESGEEELYLPVSCDQLTFYTALPDQIIAHWKEGKATERGKEGNLDLYDANGRVLATLKGMHYRKTSESSLKKMLEHELSIEDWIYDWNWEEYPLDFQEKPRTLGRCLFIGDEKNNTDLTSMIEKIGGSFKAINFKDFKSSDEYLELFQQESFDAILHISDINNSDKADLASIKQTQNSDTKSLLLLLQALISLDEAPNIPIFILSSPNIIFSPLDGLHKTALLENPQLNIKRITLEPEWYKSTLEKTLLSDGDESIFLIKKEQCLVPRLARSQIEGNEISKPAISSEASYLITGGLGGLGLSLAEWLAKNGAGHVVLTGRKPLSKEIESILENLKGNNTEFSYESIDISDETQVSSLFETIHKHKNPLKGIFHLAGVLDDAVLPEQNWERFTKVFAPKIFGSFLLHKNAKDLDYFVLFSSISSTLGNPGQSNYAAANAFMDALCAYRKERGLPAKSLSWGPWAEIGMAKELVARHAKGGFIGMKPKEAFHAFETAISLPQAHTTIADIHWKNYLGQLITPPSWLNNFFSEKGESESILDQLEIVDVDERPQAIKEIVSTIVCSVLGIEEMKPADEKKGFFDMGLDSLMAVELKNRLQSMLGKAAILSSTVVFDHSSVEKLSSHISKILNLEGIKVRKKEPEAKSIASTEPIAIIGMGCRLPGGANSPEKFWDLLESGTDGIKEVPIDRFDVDAFYDPNFDVPGKMYTRSGGFLNVPVDTFDAEFFGISPKEAVDMDPQQRLLLEVTWEALEDAVIAPDKLIGTSTGFFVGIMNNDYQQLIIDSSGVEGMSAYFGSGTAFSAAVGRVSFVLGLQGPCMAIDTACSSSLVAINAACESLRLGECSEAIAGGVNLMLAPGSFISACQAHMLAPDGHCKTFDKSGDGYARGEGCGIVVLKRVSDALRDGDRIHAVIRGIAVNQGGATSGLTVPNGEAQESLIKHVSVQARLSPNDIDYIEAHGTGTSLGDPIEVRAIGAAYGDRDKNHPLLIGSAKSNIGHTESAAGVAGVIKTVLALKHEVLPPNLNLKELNPHIELNFPGEIVQKSTPWPKKESPRRAGVSSFGFSGINAHLILEDPPKSDKHLESTKERPLHILTISAKSEAALEALIDSYEDYLENTKENLADICYSANTGRNHESYRVAVISKDMKELQSKLKSKEYSIGNTEERKPFQLSSTDQEEDKFDELAEAYVNGAEIDWEEFDKPYTRKKVSLPTYPFQKVRYWSDAAKVTVGKKLAAVHPLLGEKQLKPDSQVHFTGELHLSQIPYLKNHKVYDEIIYPGAAYLEMLFAACAFGIGDGLITIHDFDIEAALSITPGAPTEIQTHLKPDQSDYEAVIYSLSTTEAWIQHTTAKVQVQKSWHNPSPLNLDEIKKQCHSKIKTDAFYKKMKDTGIYYGSDFQTLRTIQSGENEILAELKTDSMHKEYFAHPTLLDGCLQLMGASLWSDGIEDLYLPTGCDSLKLFSSLPSQIFAYLKLNEGSESVRSCDITLTDSDGNILLQIDGMRYRKTTEEAVKQMLSHEKSIEEWLYVWDWEDYSVDATLIPDSVGHWLILGDEDESKSIIEQIEKRGGSYHLLSSVEAPKSREEYVELIEKSSYEGILHLFATREFENLNFELIKNAQSLGSESFLNLCQALDKLETLAHIPVIIMSTKGLHQSTLDGLFKTAALENPQQNFKHIKLAESWDPEIGFNLLFAEGESLFLLNQTKAYAGKLSRVSKEKQPNTSIKLDPNAAYLITGGLGGIGLTLAKWLLKNGAKHLILTGRSDPDESLFNSLNGKNTSITYEKVDISHEKAVADLFKKLSKLSTPLKGVFHLAGILDDATLPDQNWNRFEKVFAPKVYGSFFLHKYSKDLDLFVLFSSVASSIGNPGQSNYAAANSFMDALCLERREKGLPAQSISWGAWSEVGMAKDLASRHAKGGILGIRPNDGMRAFEAATETNLPHITVANINWKNLMKQLTTLPSWLSSFGSKKVDEEGLLSQLAATDSEQYLEIITEYIGKMIREVLALADSSSIDPKKGFSNMGLDSLMAIELTNRLQAGIGKAATLSKTAVFDHSNIEKMALHILSLIGKRELKKPQIKKPEVKSDVKEPIAIVGIGCRFPGGGNNPEEFWNVLESGIDGICEIPKDRFDVDRYFDPQFDLPGKMYTRKGGFLKFPIDEFDAEFFEISPKEAEDMDPQQRMLLEVVWEALEDALIPPRSLEGTATGLFVGMMFNDYSELILQSKGIEGISSFYGTGNAFSAAVGRVSFTLGLQGPSLAVDTACSSSLVAINSACESLWQGHSQQAIAGGVNLLLAPSTFIATCQAHMLSPDGHCKTFDASADGYARAEGCGIIVLKRLSDAERNGDKIYGVIKNIGVNQGGATSGLTVPNGAAQESLIQEVYSEGHIDPSEVDYVEAHGTGTSLGDPIEVRALEATYGQRDSSEPLLLGSVKSNIGHTEAAAGVAGVIKTILAMKHQTLPPNLNFNQLNPHINLNFPVKVVTENTPWPKRGHALRAAISSFGFSGINAHLILEEWEQDGINSTEIEEDLPHILTLSAKTEAALDDLLNKYVRFIDTKRSNIADLCYSSNVGRTHERYRIAVIAENLEELKSKLSSEDFYRGKTETTKPYKLNKDEILNDLASAYTEGATIDWNLFHSSKKRKKVSLPTYPFQRKRYWAIDRDQTPDTGKTVHVKREKVDSGLILALASQMKTEPEEEQKKFILKYLRVCMGDILGADSEQIKGDIPLKEFGFDSIMLASLQSKFKADLDILFDLAEIDLENDLNTLSNLLFSRFQPSTSEKTSNPYDSRVPKILHKQPNKKYQLFLIPPLGFGETSYKNWPKQFPEKYECIYLGFTYNGDWNQMIADMAKSVKEIAESPFLIYGHSMGGVVAYELVKYLEAEMNLNPESLIVSSVAPPAQLSRSKFAFPFNAINLENSQEAIDLLIEGHFLPPRNMSIRMLPEEGILNDAKALLDYSGNSTEKIATPIIAIQANNDVLVRDGRLVSEWSEYTSGFSSYAEIDGTHMFFLNPPDSVFELIKKVSQDTAENEAFKPGIYKLSEFISGSDSNITYPFGKSPKGYLIYDPSTNGIAAHLWDSNIESFINPSNPISKKDMIEANLLSLAYSGEYNVKNGEIDHHVNISSFPNYTNDILSRHYQYQKETLVLSSKSKTKRKQIPEQFMKLSWSPLSSEISTSQLVGHWKLISYRESGVSVLGNIPDGRLIISDRGFFSLQLASSKREDFKDHNMFLATDEELISSFESYRSVFGKYKVDENSLSIKVEALSPLPFNPKFIVEYKVDEDKLTLACQIGKDKVELVLLMYT